MNTPKLHCNFCGKSVDDVDQLVAGTNCYICTECISWCACIIHDQRYGAERKPKVIPA